MALPTFSTLPDDLLIQIFTLVRIPHLQNPASNLAHSLRLSKSIHEPCTISSSSDPQKQSPKGSSIEKSVFAVHAKAGLRLGLLTSYS